MLIAREWADSTSDWVNALSSVLLALLGFTPFTASRWATLGTASRSYLVSMLLGYESIFQAMRDRNFRKLITDYELHGFAKLDLVGVKFLVSTAFISYVSE
eukprot:323646-Amphidinium_carterae.1